MNRGDTEVFDTGGDGQQMEHVLATLPQGFDLTNEDEFVQAGALLVDHIRVCTIALGELLAWKLRREMAVTDSSRDQIFGRYAKAWGTSHTSLVRAWVLATKHSSVPRPEDIGPTAQYEILSGSETPEEAEAGFEMATRANMGVEKIREAKMLQSLGLSKREDWEVPYLYFRDGYIWARASNGDRVRVWKRVEEDKKWADKAEAISKRRLHI
jgi:hypothetical protein